MNNSPRISSSESIHSVLIDLTIRTFHGYLSLWMVGRSRSKDSLCQRQMIGAAFDLHRYLLFFVRSYRLQAFLRSLHDFGAVRSSQLSWHEMKGKSLTIGSGIPYSRTQFEHVDAEEFSVPSDTEYPASGVHSPPL